MTVFDTSNVGLLPPRVSERARAAARVRAPAWPRRTFLLAVGWVLLIAAIAFAKWPLSDAIVPWDSKNQFYPMFRFLADSLRHGTVPMWNPYQFAGQPFAADPQSLLFTPTMLLFAFLIPDATMQVFDAVIFAHLALGAIGMVGLARRWRWHPAAGVLAAGIFMLGGAACSRLEHTGMIISYSWYPLALWSLQAALDRRSLRLAVIAGLFATLMALGRDQVAFLLCAALAGAVVRQAFRADHLGAYVRARAGVLLMASATVLIAMLVPIALTLQFLQNSNRPGIVYGLALSGSLDPINLLTMLVPNLFGSLDRIHDYWGPGGAPGTGSDWTDPNMDYLYVGTVPVVLLIWHGLVGARLLERGARYFAIVLVGSLVYAFGRHTALFQVFFDWVPGVSLYRRPADATFLVNIAVAFASGYLMHRFVEEGLPRLDLTRPATAVLPIMTAIGAAWLAGAAFSFARQAGHFDRSILATLVAMGTVVPVLVVFLVWRAPRRRPIIAAGLVAAAVTQLILCNAASVLNAEPVARYAANADLPPAQAAGLAALRADMAMRRSGGVDARIEVQGIDGPWQNASLIYKLQNLAGYNPLRVDVYQRAVGVSESTNDATLRSFPNTFRGYNSRLAAMLDLHYLVLSKRLEDLPQHYPRPHATLLYGADNFYIYRLDNPDVPRVHVAKRVIPIDSDDAIDLGDVPAFDPVDEALVEQDDLGALHDRSRLADAPAAGSIPAAERSSSARILSYGSNRIVVDVDDAQGGLLVFHDIVFPGWQARVDGKPEAILRTDLLFRGVEVASGHHTVEFSFHPFSATNLLDALHLTGRDE